LKLQTAPIPTAIVKFGMLTKRGDSVKNWKARFFKAYNAADNYKIEYYDGTNESGKLKGTIWCAGYRAQHVYSDEHAEFGEFGIKLVPWSYRRRTWYIKCADEAERKEWMNVFENACWKSKPPRDEDDCIADAFSNALQACRWRYWFWGWYSDAGSEGERLGEFILDVLDREVINAILDGIAENPAKSMTVDLVRKTIGGTVKAAASSAWTSAVTAVRSTSTTIQSQVKDAIGPLLEKQKAFKEQIVAKVMGTVTPFLSSKGSDLLKPILNVILKPITDAFILAAKGFHSHMSSKITSNEFAPTKFNSTLDYTDWQMDWWSGPIYRAYEIVSSMYSSDLAVVASLFVGGITPYTVYNMVLDKLRMIIHRAVFTFGQLAKAVGESEHAGVLAHVTQLLFHDCMIMIKSTIMTVLTAILDSPLQELVIKPCNELIAPIQDMINAVPVINMLFDLPTMLAEVVGSIEEGSLTALISGGLSDIKNNMALASTELGLGSLTL